MKLPLSLYLKHGPVGLWHAVKLEWLARRAETLKRHMAMECAMHEENMAILKAEMERVAKAQQRHVYAAARYWVAVGAQWGAKR